MAKFTELTDQKLKDNVLALTESLHKDYLPNSYQVTIKNNTYSIGGNSYSNTIIYAACQTYTECQNDFVNGDWVKIQNKFKKFLHSDQGFYGLEYDENNLKPYLNMRVIYYNALYNTIAYNVMLGEEVASMPEFISAEEIKNSVCWLLTYGEYIDYNLNARKTTIVNELYSNIKNIYDQWGEDEDLSSHDRSIRAQRSWLSALETLRDDGIAFPPSDNGKGEIFGYSHIASVVWWLKSVLKDSKGLDDTYFIEYPFYGMSKQSVSSGQNINIMENWNLYETNDSYKLTTNNNGVLNKFWINDYWTYHINYDGDINHGVNYQIWDERAKDWKEAYCNNLSHSFESRNMLTEIIKTIVDEDSWFATKMIIKLHNLLLTYFKEYKETVWYNFAQRTNWSSISFNNFDNWNWMHKYIIWAAIMFLRLKVYYEMKTRDYIPQISLGVNWEETWKKIYDNCNDEWQTFIQSFLRSFLIEAYYRFSGKIFQNNQLIEGTDDTGIYWIDIIRQGGFENYNGGSIFAPEEESSWDFKYILIDYYSNITGANGVKKWGDKDINQWPNYTDETLEITWNAIKTQMINLNYTSVATGFLLSFDSIETLWTTVKCPGVLNQPSNNTENGMFGYSAEEIEKALLVVFGSTGVPLILSTEYVQQIASDPVIKFPYSYQLLGEQQCKYYNKYWKDNIKKYIESSSIYEITHSTTFPALYQEDTSGEIIFDTQYKPTYTFINLSNLEATKNNLNNTNWNLQLKTNNDSGSEDSPEENPEPPIIEEDKTEPEIVIPPKPSNSNNNEIIISGPTLIITGIDKSADGSKINGITFELKGLSSDYNRGDRRVWLSMEDGEGNWVGDQRNYDLSLEEDNGVYHIPDGEIITKDIKGQTLRWNFINPIPYNDMKYKIYCKMAWSPATLRQEYMLNNELKEEWKWLIDTKFYNSTSNFSISPIFSLEEIKNNNFKVGKPIEKYEKYIYNNYSQTILDIYANLFENSKESFCNVMKDFSRSRGMMEIRELLKYMPLPSFEDMYNYIQKNTSNVLSLTSYFKTYYNEKLQEDPREKQIYTIVSSFRDIEANIQPPTSGGITIITPPTIDYTDWLTSDINVTSIGSTQYKALFPPILESSQPAFDAEAATEYEIFFKLSDYTNFNEVGHVDFRIVFQSDNSSAVNSSYWIDEIIYVPHKHIRVNSNGTYSVKIPINFIKKEAWEANSYYKIQARFGTDFNMWKTSTNSSDNDIKVTNTDIQNYRIWRDSQIKNGWFSEWSTVMVIKPIIPPTVQILNSLGANANYSFKNLHFKPVEFTDQPQIYGYYKSMVDENNKQQELLDYYCFDLYVIDEEGLGQFVETSGWNKYDGSLNILNKNGLDEEYLTNELASYNISNNVKNELISSVVICWQPKNKLEQNKQYYVYFTIQTQNKYITNAVHDFQIANSTLNYFGKMQDEKLIAIPNEEEGLIELQFYSGHYIQNQIFYNAPISGNFVLTRCKVGENVWEDIQHFSIPELQKSYNYETLCYDLAVESGIEYKYGIQKEYYGSIRSNRLESNSTLVNFEHSYLVGENKQLKIKFDPKISSFKHTMLASKQDTLGGKYPLILRNGQAYYAEFPIEGLITLHSDENGMFITRKTNGIYYDNEQIIPGNKFKQEISGNYDIIRNNRGERAEILGQNEIENNYYFDTNLTDNNIFIERKFREKVEEFLNSPSPKLFKSATEGNIIVNLMNVSLTPKQELGRAIYSFSATAYEIAENTVDNLNKYKIIDLSKFNPILSEGYTMGQISGYFDKTTDIIKLIEQDVKKRSTTEIQFEPKMIKQLKFEHYPKVNLDNEIEEINYNIIKEATSYSEVSAQTISNLVEQRDTLQQLQNYLKLKDGYPPCELKINTNKITMLGNKPYQLDNLNWEFGSNSVQIIPYEYKQNDIIQSIPVPMIITYVVVIDYVEPIEVHASQGDYYKSLDSIFGYFVNPKSALSNMFIYKFYDFINDPAGTNSQLPLKETSKIYLDDTYYNNYDVMQVIVNKIEQDFEKKATNKNFLLKLKELNGVAVEKPMWYFLDAGYYYLLEFVNIQELIIEAEPGTTFYLNRDNKQKGQKITIGPNGLYQLSPLEIDMINTNKTLLIDENVTPDMAYLNLRFTYELNVIQTISKYLGIDN